MMNLKIVLVDAFEPDAYFVEFLTKLKSEGFEVLVVNDGSSVVFDKTFEEASKFVKVLSHEFNRGIGAVIKTGLFYIQNNCKGNYVVVTLNYNKKYEIEDIKKVCEESLSNPNSLVLGSKRRNKTISFTNLSKEATRFLYQKKTGVDVYDTNAGLFAFSNSLVDFLLNVKGSRMDYEMNLLLKCADQKIAIQEVALTQAENVDILEKKKREVITPEKEIFKFAMLSPFGLGIDFVLFLVLFLFSKQAMLSLVFAKIVSSIIDYSRDKNQVYKVEPDVSKVAKLYFLFVFLIVLVDCLLFGFLSTFFGIPVVFAKIIGEIAVYAVCFGIREGFPEPIEKKDEK